MWIDDLITAPVQLITKRGVHPPLEWLLGSKRREVAQRIRERHVARAGELGAALDRGDAGAREALIELADVAHAELATEVKQELSRYPTASLLARLDERFHGCTTREHMDNPKLPAHHRRRLVARLDQLNHVLGSYESFWQTLRPLLNPDGRTRILELASGTGGFALWLARRSREEGLDVAVTASDVNSGLLAEGAAAAQREGLPVRFTEADALNLRSLEGDWDVILCTQALHHFPPGWITVMYQQAAGRAKRGVLFLDGCRSALSGAAFVALGWARFRDVAFSHDAWVSFRRFHVPEELGLLCGLGPWGAVSDARWIPPGHCAVGRRCNGMRTRP